MSRWQSPSRRRRNPSSTGTDKGRLWARCSRRGHWHPAPHAPAPPDHRHSSSRSRRCSVALSFALPIALPLAGSIHTMRSPFGFRPSRSPGLTRTSGRTDTRANCPSIRPVNSSVAPSGSHTLTSKGKPPSAPTRYPRRGCGCHRALLAWARAGKSAEARRAIRHRQVDKIHRRRADKAADKARGRPLIQRLRPVDLFDDALVHDRDAVSEAHRLGLVMGHIHGGGAGGGENAFSSERISSRNSASRFDKGSSINSTAGCTASARATATRCRCPPDNFAG